jgi:uncharacterized protein (TIGR03000 family)
MFTIVLATALATGQAAPAADIQQEILELKKSVEQLRQEQNDARIDELKLVIAGLRQRVTDEKLDEIRRDVRLLQEQEAPYVVRPLPVRAARFVPSGVVVPSATRATIAVKVPAGASFVVNDKEIPVPPVDPTFVTPVLEPGKDYFYDCKVTVTEDGKTVTRTKRVKIQAGEVIRIDYKDMEAK